MNTEQCKALIMEVMNKLIANISLDEMAEYRRQTGNSIQDVLDLKSWKRARKWGSGSIVHREFTHTKFSAVVEIREITKPSGIQDVEIEMIDIPALLERSSKELGVFELKDGRTATQKDRPSMTEGPKPEGFGMFA